MFSTDSVFLRYMGLSEQTRALFMFRRLNTCRHKHSCLESILRKFYQSISTYLILRLPVSLFFAYLISKSNTKEAAQVPQTEAPATGFLQSNTFLIIEASLVLLGALIRSAGACFVRYLHEEDVLGTNNNVASFRRI